MPRLDFHRIDLQLILRRTREGMRLRFGSPASYHEHDLSRDEMEAVLSFTPEGAATIFKAIPLQEALNEWLLSSKEAPPPPPAEASKVDTLARITLDIDDPALSRILWEYAISQSIAVRLDFTTVRTSSVRPRFASVPFTLPLRILQFDAAEGKDLKAMIRQALGTKLSDEVAEQAIEVYAFKLSDIKGWEPPHQKPTAEILHFDSMPPWVEADGLFSTASPERAGTLGWLARVTNIWQTRLVIINCSTKCEAEDARRLASELVNRGGPAVLVCDFEAEMMAAAFYEELYSMLIHDFPLDACLHGAMKSAALPASLRMPSLFVGAGREEGVRVSTLGLKLLGLERELSNAPEGASAAEVLELFVRTREAAAAEGERESYFTLEEVRNLVLLCIRRTTGYPEFFLESLDERLADIGIQTYGEISSLVKDIDFVCFVAWVDRPRLITEAFASNVKPEWRVRDLVQAVYKQGQQAADDYGREIRARKATDLMGKFKVSLSNLRDSWNNITFERSEREGIIPLTESVNAMRKEADVQVPVTYEKVTPKATGPRYVNSSLWSVGPDETLQQMERDGARLRVGETYHLGIQIGEEDVRFRAAGASALIEEIFKWTPQMKGVWLEVGVTGIDFDVLGDPVQELWLPREFPTEFIYFAVSPKVSGAARLRFCIYYQQNLIQSFRLAALTSEHAHPYKIFKDRVGMLASALDLTEKDIDEAGYMSRLEYSLTASAEGIETRPPRDLSIVANDYNGVTLVTLKGRDTFVVLNNGDPSDLVKRVRHTLKRVSTIPDPNEPNPENWNFAFGPYQEEAVLKNALREMAIEGRHLYDQLFPDEVRGKVDSLLEDGGTSVIHVAHILRNKVIPWAALYDRPYSQGKKEVAVGQELKLAVHDVCLAALPDENGRLPVSECGKHENCPLHPDRQRDYEAEGKVAVEATIVCPLRFWGFRHVIEIPPQQQSRQEEAHPQRDCILYAGSQPRLAVGFNASLNLWANHWAEVEKLAQWKSKTVASRLAFIVQALENEELDLIYFYCHARGGDEDQAGNPEHLVFQEGPQAMIEKLDIDGFPLSPKWTHHPLVILNGCGTVGFSPDALSPFLKKLVVDQGSAGVLGTEAPVREELATDAVKYFLERFLAGDSAGEALLAMRRILLAKKNPLGLVYTLYAPAHLKLDRDGDGKCQKLD